MTDKHEQLLLAAITLFAREGFWNTSTAAVAREAGVATGTLFNYFQSKSDLIDEVFGHLKTELADAISEELAGKTDTATRMKAIWMGYFTWALANPIHRKLLMQLKLSDLVSKSAQDASEQQFAFALEVIEAGIRDGLIEDLEPAYIAGIAHAHLEATLTHALGDTKSQAQRLKFAETGFSLFWKSIMR